MTAVAVALPRRAHRTGLTALERDLRREVDGEVRFDDGSRAAYSTDASNYRHVPVAVVVPRSVDAAVDAIAVCRRHGAPIVSRGGGTSLGGQTTNTAIVIDWSKYVNRMLSVDPDQRMCVVEPGMVLDHLNAELSPHALEFGPRPATHSHCTIGGMIGNNSCGATAQRTGKVVDNVRRLEVLLYDGTRMWVGRTTPGDLDTIAAGGGRRAELYRDLRELVSCHADEIRHRYPDIPRRVSGYNLDSLLPEKGFDVARALVGSEGTLVTILRAELELVPTLRKTALTMVAYPDIAAAADDVPAVVASGPTALEALDAELVGLERRKHLNPGAVDLVPDGGAWLLVQMEGETRAAAVEATVDMLARIGRRRDDPTVVVFEDPRHEQELWRVRESALGATARIPGRADAWPGWEDSAVHPDRLGDYLRDLRELMGEFGYGDASLYGHFGQGCVHTRIPFDLVTANGVSQFRSFVEEAARLVHTYGGSLSGEHGDGQARSELLATMFGPEITSAFARMKATFDPGNRMNPGRIVDPSPLDHDLRLGTDFDHGPVETHFRYPDDSGSFSRAVQRCVGVGRCRRTDGGVMCPSYMVTREEEHSTRGRARLLFEMLDGSARGGTIGDAWRSEAVRDALDLCLMCKGCKSDCPVGVDMATYKAEFLAHHYRGRIRPRAHYSMGWLPAAALAGSKAPSVVNAVTQSALTAPLIKRLAGVDSRRRLPTFARRSFVQWFATHRGSTRAERGDVVIFPDTFTNRFHPQAAIAAVRLLEDAGWHPIVPREPMCCGLTWISTGQLRTAKHVLRRTVRKLRPHLRAGALVLGLEPSCTAVLRSDAHELFPHDADVVRLERQTVTLAELLDAHSEGWNPPRVGGRAIVQTHCHHHAILGTEHDDALLAAAGVDAHRLDSGCCGLAGNFGFEAGHFDVSEACAERVLMPAVREADGAAVVADGFSCRTQIEQLDSAGHHAMHLAELLASGLGHATGTRGAPR